MNSGIALACIALQACLLGACGQMKGNKSNREAAWAATSVEEAPSVEREKEKNKRASPLGKAVAAAEREAEPVPVATRKARQRLFEEDAATAEKLHAAWLLADRNIPKMIADGKSPNYYMRLRELLRAAETAKQDEKHAWQRYHQKLRDYWEQNGKTDAEARRLLEEELPVMREALSLAKDEFVDLQKRMADLGPADEALFRSLRNEAMGMQKEITRETTTVQEMEVAIQRFRTAEEKWLEKIRLSLSITSRAHDTQYRYYRAIYQAKQAIVSLKAAEQENEPAVDSDLNLEEVRP